MEVKSFKDHWMVKPPSYRFDIEIEADLLEELVVAHLAAGVVGGAQVVEQVRYDDKQGRIAMLEAAVGDGCRQVRLAGAGKPGQCQPAFGVFGKFFGGIVSRFKALLVGGLVRQLVTDIAGAAPHDHPGVLPEVYT